LKQTWLTKKSPAMPIRAEFEINVAGGNQVILDLILYGLESPYFERHSF
jgi:hypothetical protein